MVANDFLHLLTRLVKGRLLTKFGKASCESFCPCPKGVKCDDVNPVTLRINYRDTLKFRK